MSLIYLVFFFLCLFGFFVFVLDALSLYMISVYICFMVDYFREQESLDRILGLLLLLRNSRQDYNSEVSGTVGSDNLDELIEYCDSVIAACSNVKLRCGR